MRSEIIDAKIIPEVIKIFNILGRMPTCSELDKLSTIGKISTIIHNNYGGMGLFAEAIGLPRRIVANGTWANLEFIKNIILPINQNGYMPTKNMIIELISDACYQGIKREWGGLKKLAKILNLKISDGYLCSDGHYAESSNEYIFDEFLTFLEIPHEVHLRLPDSHYYCDFKINDIYIEIWGYSKELSTYRYKLYNQRRLEKEKTYNKLGLKLLSIEYDIFFLKHDRLEEKLKSLLSSVGINFNYKSGLQNVLQQASAMYRKWSDDIIEEKLNIIISKLGYFPSKDECNRECIGLYNAMKVYHGPKYWLQKFDIIKKPLIAWNARWSEEVITEDLCNIIKKIGHFPTLKELEELNRTDLVGAIGNDKGSNYYRDKLNIPRLCKPNGYWTPEIITLTFDNITKKLRKFPTWHYLDKHGFGITGGMRRNKINIRWLKNNYYQTGL